MVNDTLRPDLKVNKAWIAKYTDPATTSQYTPLTGDPVVGVKVYLVCEFSNIGDDLKGSWKIGYYIDGKQVYSQNFGDIPAGHSQNPAGWYIPDKVGSHQYECILDDGNAITEKDENNNKMRMQFNAVQNPKAFNMPDNMKTTLPQPKLPPVK